MTEVRQKVRGGFLSSDDNQIYGHLTNMAARFKLAIAGGFGPSFTLVTTADVRFSLKSAKFAESLHIDYYHWTFQYKIEGSTYIFQQVNQQGRSYRQNFWSNN